MAEYSRAPSEAYVASEVMGKHIRAKVLASGQIAIAGAADSDIGTTNGYAHTAGDSVGVDHCSLQGTEIGIAAVTIAAGDKLYGAADGKIGKTNTNVPIGIAKSAASADDPVEFIRRQI